MASDSTRQCDLANSNMVFLSLAMKIDSSLHQNLQVQLRNVDLMNGYFAMMGMEELIPVGSCMDGSKVNTLTDYGDVDILLVPKKYVLNEQLFDYDPNYPAFLHVRGDSEHANIFKNVKLVDGFHVPVMVLKQIQKHYFHLVPLFIHSTMASDIPSKGETFNAVKRSGVGLEFAKLDVGNFDLNGFLGQQHKDVDDFRLFAKFMDSTIDAFIDFGMNADREAKPVRSRKCKEIPKEESSTNIMISTAIKAVNLFTGKYKEEQLSESTSPNSCFPKTDDIKDKEIDLEDGDVILRYNNNLDIDESDESDEDYDDITASMPEANESNHDDDDSDDQKVSLPRLLSADFVPAFKFDDWPRPAAEWKTRKRQWPSEEIVKQVVECGCHIVSKRPLFSDLNGDPENEDNSPESDKTNTFFRLSFSRCELILANSLTETQKCCWRILKAYQKAFLGTEPKVLASYHWKNVVFWVSEETDPSFWTEDNVLFGVCKALDFMITCLQQKNIPVYFVRNENLIAGCKHEVIEEAVARVISIRKNPIGYLQLFIENPPQSLPYRVSRSALKTSLETQSSKTEYVLGTMVDSMRDFPELVSDKDFYSKMPCKVLEFWQAMKNEIEENETSNKSSELIGKADKLFNEGLGKSEDQRAKDGDSISKTFGGVISAFTSVFDDHLKENPSKSTLLHGTSAFFETVKENILNVSEGEPLTDVPSGIKSFLSKLGERLQPNNNAKEEDIELD